MAFKIKHFSGSTLIEVLVSMIIISIVILGFFDFSLKSKRITDKAQKKKHEIILFHSKGPLEGAIIEVDTMASEIHEGMNIIRNRLMLDERLISEQFELVVK